jgi:phosphohistidine phosphatase
VTRRLVVLRHAKSSYPSGVVDHERPLGARGVVDARAAGAWIRDHVGLPDRVIVSSALRTRQTWILASAEMGFPASDGAGGADQLTVEPRVYEAWVPTLIDVLRELPDEVTTALLVGHNPGCENLVHDLARDSDPAAAAALALKYPTSGIAVLDLEGDWASLGPRTARLVEFAVPRG